MSGGKGPSDGAGDRRRDACPGDRCEPVAAFAGDDGGQAVDPFADIDARQTRWAGGWRRVVFPGVFLLYLLQTAAGVADHNDGAVEVVGYLVLVAFCVAYLVALPRCSPAGGTGSGWPTG